MNTFPKYYRVKVLPLKGSRYAAIRKQALLIFKSLTKKTKRTPYIRSKYFNKEKVFINLLIPHFFDKKPYQRIERFRLVPCGIELIKKSNKKPFIKKIKSEKLFRFFGKTTQNSVFIVQIKEDYRGRKYWMSIFPYK